MTEPFAPSLRLQREPLSAAAPTGTHPTPHKPGVKDLEREMKRDGDVEEGFDPGDDSDLGLHDEDDEDVGLDTAVGLDDPADDLDMPDDDEDEGWSTDVEDTSEQSDELHGNDSDLFPGEEYGWIDDSDVGDDDESFDPDMSDEPEARDDEGAEGLEDDSELEDMDLSDLPDIDADAEEDAAGSGGDSIEEIAAMGLIDEPSLEIVVGELWKALPAGSVRVTTVAELEAAPSSLVAVGTHCFICVEGSLLLSVDGHKLRPLAVPSGSATAVAAIEYEGELHVAAVVGGRVFVSRDAGNTFVLHELTSSVTQLAYTRGAAGPRLWWQTARGGLGTPPGVKPATRVEGEVLAFHADGKRAISVLVRRQGGRVWLSSSTDAGQRFASMIAPPLAAEPDARLRVCREAVLLAARNDVQCTLPPLDFEPVSTLARAPAALSDEEDEAFVYASVQRDDELFIVRRSARAKGAAPLVLVSLGRDVVGEPEELAVSYLEGGTVSVYLATTRALVRIEASLDGEELA